MSDQIVSLTESYKNGTHYHVALILHPLKISQISGPQSATPILHIVFMHINVSGRLVLLYNKLID